MPESWRRFLAGLLLFLAAGGFVGWLYGHTETGLLVAALAALAFQVRQLLAFDRALRSGNFDAFRHGEGLWAQLFSRFAFLKELSARDKRRYRELLREIRKSTNAMPDGAVVIDNDNEIVMCNRAAKQLAGFRPKKDRGQRVDNILRDPELAELLVAGDADMTVEIESPVRSGDWLNCRVVPYGADQKMLLLRDVTERMRLNKMRRDFVANASHELRSPLTVISGYLDSMDEDETLAEWQMPLTQMRAQALRMKKIITELMELSRLESAGRAGTADTVDVAALIDSACRAWQGRPGVPAIEVDADAGIRIRGNGTQIESVISNLVSNAIRHTPVDGVITVSWKRSKRGAVLGVEDTGEGIAAEDVPRLTERFFRVDRGRSRDDGGVGLGLAIVKHILSRHDATLVIDSVPGEGSRFRCQFPKERIAETPVERGAARTAQG
ncbi:MAG: phosphate regulon sensor histidine kinase PhoR [Woeseiaceae bacterium]|nr:phosphate regulon sensor histidine kinase PhoR [Woeseiaceae bacterium]